MKAVFDLVLAAGVDDAVELVVFVLVVVAGCVATVDALVAALVVAFVVDIVVGDVLDFVVDVVVGNVVPLVVILLVELATVGLRVVFSKALAFVSPDAGDLKIVWCFVNADSNLSCKTVAFTALLGAVGFLVVGFAPRIAEIFSNRSCRSLLYAVPVVLLLLLYVCSIRECFANCALVGFGKFELDSVLNDLYFIFQELSS